MNVHYLPGCEPTPEPEPQVIRIQIEPPAPAPAIKPLGVVVAVVVSLLTFVAVTALMAG